LQASRIYPLRKGCGRDGERNQQDDDGRQLREAIGYISHVLQLPLILFYYAVPAQVLCKVYASFVRRTRLHPADRADALSAEAFRFQTGRDVSPCNYRDNQPTVHL
jgi:hypothetical protein